jgi:hypothetical protein
MIDDLRNMTEAELKKLSAAQLVDLVLQERTTSVVTRQVGDKRGMLKYVTETRDYKGKLTGSETTLTTYKSDGSVDVITKISKDKDGKEAKRTEIHHEPESTTCTCGCQMKRIGEDVAEKLDYTTGWTFCGGLLN